MANKTGKKTVFPTKQEVINTLLAEDPNPKGFEKIMRVIEHKKISKALGLLKAEGLQNGKVFLKGSMACIPERTGDSFDWSMLTDNQSHFEGYSLDYQGETMGTMIKQGLKKRIKEGSIPFLGV